MTPSPDGRMAKSIELSEETHVVELLGGYRIGAFKKSWADQHSKAINTAAEAFFEARAQGKVDEALEMVAGKIKGIVDLLLLKDEKRYDGDEGPVEKRCCEGISEFILSMKSKGAS
jgi:hypothetical protein